MNERHVDILIIGAGELSPSWLLNVKRMQEESCASASITALAFIASRRN